MGDFHERLIQARRDGTAPGMPGYLPEDPEPETREAGPEATFSASLVAGMWSCSLCFGTVDGRLTPNHADWHRRLGA